MERDEQLKLYQRLEDMENLLLVLRAENKDLKAQCDFSERACVGNQKIIEDLHIEIAKCQETIKGLTHDLETLKDTAFYAAF